MKTLRILLMLVPLLSMGATNTTPDDRPAAAKRHKSGLEMVLVAGGTFTMGGRDHVDDGGPRGGADRDECPHRVMVGDFAIGRYEVTQADWTAIMGSNPSYFAGEPERPVEQVSWNDVQEFIRRLNRKLDDDYRLPTEEEWEFAARGGLASRGSRYSGSNDPDEVAWHRGNSRDRSHPVGSLKPNELGLYDMSGNVSEWCDDFKRPYPCDAQGKAFDSRVLRGGTWGSRANSVRVRDRNGRTPDHRLHTLGFRLAKSP